MYSISAVLIFFFVFGVIIGSFLNVVILRYGTRTFAGRSLCFLCGQSLRWYELIPLFSFSIQRGRCRGCLGRISLQYPLVELITGLVFATVAWKELPASLSSLSLFSILCSLFSLFLWSLLIALSIYDFKHKIIPDGLVYSALAVAFLIFLARLLDGAVSHAWLEAFGGLLFAIPFGLLWFFSKGKAIGLGDAKLLLLFSWFLGFERGLSALIVGFWIGAIAAIFAILLKSILSFLPRNLCPTLQAKLKNLGLKTELPLGPFLVLGLFIVYVFGWDVTGLTMLLQA